MRARLALAQALLPQPELLILDEPGDGLDPEGIHEMRQTILRLHHELGLTILLSSHLLNEVEQLCTRIAVLNRGRKVFRGHAGGGHAQAALGPAAHKRFRRRRAPVAQPRIDHRRPRRTVHHARRRGGHGSNRDARWSNRACPSLKSRPRGGDAGEIFISA